MKAIVIDENVLQEILDKLAALEVSAKGLNEDPTSKWIDNQEFCQLLKVSPRTAQNYRDNGIVAFSQPGSKVYYRMSDVQAMLENHYVPVNR
jgi:hypothetical protein